jgi:hypothetical protein
VVEFDPRCATRPADRVRLEDGHGNVLAGPFSGPPGGPGWPAAPVLVPGDTAVAVLACGPAPVAARAADGAWAADAAAAGEGGGEWGYRVDAAGFGSRWLAAAAWELRLPGELEAVPLALPGSAIFRCVRRRRQARGARATRSRARCNPGVDQV